MAAPRFAATMICHAMSRGTGTIGRTENSDSPCATVDGPGHLSWEHMRFFTFKPSTDHGVYSCLFPIFSDKTCCLKENVTDLETMLVML